MTLYDTQKLERINSKLLIEYQHENEPMYKGPLAMYITFEMPIPRSWSLKKRVAAIGQFHSVKSDLDNLAKFIMDLCSEVLFQDDAQICILSCRKIYSQTPRTTFTILELNGKNKEV